MVKQGTNRCSNFELLRIVAMGMIVVHHLIVHVLGPVQIATGGSLATVAGLNALFLGGVNLFVMISGYFGIKLTWRSLIHLWLFVGLYLLLTRTGYFIYTTAHGMEGVTWRSLLLPFVLFSRSGYWFINYYFVLMLFSPLLNYALRDMPLHRLRQCILLLTFFTCYSGFVLGNTNPTGYNAVHFIYLYILGRYISREPLLERIDRNIYLGLFIVLSGLYALLASYGVGWGHFGTEYPIRLFAYNNPLLLAACASLFCYFRRLRIQSRAINWVAASVLGVYLLQESDMGRIVYEKLTAMLTQGGYTFPALLMLCGVCIGLFVAALLIDNLRKAVCVPLAAFFASRIPPKYQLNFDEHN